MKKNDNWTFLRNINIALSFGLSVVVYLLAGYYLGNWLDNKFNATPFFLITGLLGAAVLIFRAFLELVKILDHSQELEKRLQEEHISKEELRKRKVIEARESLDHAKRTLTDFEDMVIQKEREALRRIRGEKEEDPSIDSRNKLKKF